MPPATRRDCTIEIHEVKRSDVPGPPLSQHCPGKIFAWSGLFLTSPRKRGEVNPLKFLRKKSREYF
jgi:hypothetical protein